MVGRHEGKEALTIGQGARIGGCGDKYFIVSLDAANTAVGTSRCKAGRGDVIVAKGTVHPALFSSSLIVRGEDFSWVGASLPPQLKQRWAQLQLPQQRSSSSSSSSSPASSSSSSSSSPPSAASTSTSTSTSSSLSAPSSPTCHFGYKARHQQPIGQCTVDIQLDPLNPNSYQLVVQLEKPQRAITPGQILALYDQDECLGGGKIASKDHWSTASHSNISK